jgi:hypothetical protein
MRAMPSFFSSLEELALEIKGKEERPVTTAAADTCEIKVLRFRLLMTIVLGLSNLKESRN